MWRSSERASLEKKPSMRLSHDPCVGVNVKVKRPMGCAASQLVISCCATNRMSTRAVALVLVIAHHGRAGAGQWRAIRRGRTDCLDPGFLVVRDDGEAPAAAVLTPALL